MPYMKRKYFVQVCQECDNTGFKAESEEACEACKGKGFVELTPEKRHLRNDNWVKLEIYNIRRNL